MYLWVLTVIVAGAAALTVCRAAHAVEKITLVASSTPLTLDARRIDGALYVPAEPLMQAFGATVERVSDSSVTVCIAEDVCALVATDGSDPRLRPTDDGWLMAVGSAPELLRAHYAWDDAAGTVALEPGPSPYTGDLHVGDPFPDVAFPSILSGEEDELVSLGAFRGKRVVLFTWASW